MRRRGVTGPARRASDTLSTHALMREAVVQLHRWGVLEAVRNAGTPPVRSTTFHYGDEVIRVPIKEKDGVGALYAPRRTVLDLALGCDMRLMSESAVLMPGFAKMGVVPESGGTWYLPRLLGWAKACEVSMLGDPLRAQAAEDYGLVNKAVPAAEFDAVTTAWAEKVAANAPLAITEMKRLFRHGQTQDFESHSHHVLMSVLNLFRSDDFREGVRSFAEKRPPEFKGR